MHEYVDVGDLLREQGLVMEPLRALSPDADPYSVLVVQPGLEVALSTGGIGNKNRDLALKKYMKSVELAYEENVDVLVTPEYSCPWSVIEVLARDQRLPRVGKLWVFGCEAVTLAEFERIKAACEAPWLVWVSEEVNPQPGTVFLDPVCQIFAVADAGGRRCWVFLVQFKCTRASDKDLSFVEQRSLLLGTRRYVLSNDPDSVHLVTLICSDALDFSESDLPGSTHTPYMILHPQLNLNPRHPNFCRYRREAYENNREHQEFICVNWARGFFEGDITKSPFGGSAYYTKSDTICQHPDRMNANHYLGLYYTRCDQHRSHVYFFNYAECVLLFRTTKVSQGLASGVLQDTRTGPEMLKALTWDHEKDCWAEMPRLDDGLSDLCGACASDVSPFAGDAVTPLDKERLIALSTGEVRKRRAGKWYYMSNLDTLSINEDEISRRTTFTHDPDVGAEKTRFARLQQYAKLKNSIVKDSRNLPVCVADLDGCAVAQYPMVVNGMISYHHNFRREDGQGAASLAFLGICSDAFARKVYDSMAEALGDACRRLVVWYERDGIMRHVEVTKPLIDDDLGTSRKSISKDG